MKNMKAQWSIIIIIIIIIIIVVVVVLYCVLLLRLHHWSSFILGWGTTWVHHVLLAIMFKVVFSPFYNLEEPG
jgi:hypothetical protein